MRSLKTGRFVEQALGLMYWVAFSLLAVAFLSDPPFLTLALAILGGVYIGIEVHRAYERSNVRRPVASSPSLFADTLHWSIIGMIGLNYGWFVFTDRLSVVGMLPLCVVFAVRMSWKRTLLSRTPHDLPIVLLVLLTLFSGIVLTASSALSLPKVYGVILSVLVYYEIAFGVQHSQNLRLWTIALSGLGIGIAVIGLVGTDWFHIKLLNLSSLYSSIPREITNVPRSIGGGFHPNGVAGTLIFIIPIYVVQLYGGLWVENSGQSKQTRALIALTFMAFAVTVIALLLTQSRGGLLALGVACVALFFALKRNWLLGLVTVAAVPLALGLLLLAPPGILGSLQLTENVLLQSTLSALEFRRSVWKVSLDVLQTFPLFGSGIGTFDVAAYLYVTPILYSNSSATIPHAHNEILQVAMDLATPGLVAYVALLTSFARTTWRTYAWAPDEWTRRIVLGVAAGLLAHQIFGLTDAFMLGTKPGIVMWILMGIITGMYLNLAPEHLAKERAVKNNED